jgi:epoxyqueuosine reductase
MTLTLTDRQWIEQRARTAGFDIAGLAAVPEPTSPPAQLSGQRFTDWIAAGRAGEMDWLKRTAPDGQLIRADLRRAIPWAQSVLVCALNYDTAAPLSIEPTSPRNGWIARYAWTGQSSPGQSASPDAHEHGSDYHDVLLPKLHAVEADLHARFGPEFLTRSYVDTGPIVERDFAARAGIGWIGKNTCVLNQQQGSWLLLGVIITSLSLASEAEPIPAADRCGSCTRCIDACPTNALIAPRQMDAARCIAYLTIEKKGTIPEDLRPLMGRQVFGCDICQDVCPWNSSTSRPLQQNTALPPRPALINPSLAWLASLDGPAFNRWFRGSPLERTRRKRILRNVAIAMGNSADPSFLPQLEIWAAAAEDPILAEAAAWAIAQLQLAPAPAAAK